MVRRDDVFHLGVKALVTDPDGKILLLRVNPLESPGMTADPYWDLPGGRMYRGDGMIETLRRELFEETSLQFEGEARFLGATLGNIRIPVDNGDVGLVLFIYECWPERPSLRLSSEHIEFKWTDPESAGRAISVKYPLDFLETALLRG